MKSLQQGKRRVWLAAAGLALLAGVGLAALWARPPEVAALRLVAGPLVQTLLFSARVAAPSRVELGATVTARVQQVAVDEGRLVRGGEVLVRLEDAEWTAALAQARAAEQQAQARLAGLRGTGRSGVMAGVSQAESVLRAAEADLQRTQDLLARGFVSPARLDDARRAVAVAQAQLAAAQAQGAAVAEPGTEIAQARAQIELAQAASRAAEARLAQTLLRAPADGRVLERRVEPGQIVQPGRTLLVMALAGRSELEADVDERYLQQLAVGQAARVRADAFPNQPFAAALRSIAPRVDAQRGAVEVRLVVPEPPPFLREDMSLTVEVQTARRERALVLPLAALREERGSDEATVWLAVEGRVQPRNVRLGLRTLEAAEVLAGLAAGDVVLLADAAAPGARVRPRELSPASATASGRSRDDAGGAVANAMGR